MDWNPNSSYFQSLQCGVIVRFMWGFTKSPSVVDLFSMKKPGVWHTVVVNYRLSETLSASLSDQVFLMTREVLIINYPPLNLSNMRANSRISTSYSTHLPHEWCIGAALIEPGPEGYHNYLLRWRSFQVNRIGNSMRSPSNQVVSVHLSINQWK